MRCGKIFLIFRIIALIIAFGLVAADSRYCCGGVLVVGGRRVGVGDFGGGEGGGNCSENVWGGFNVFLLNFLTFEIESHFTCGELNLY